VSAFFFSVPELLAALLLFPSVVCRIGDTEDGLKVMEGEKKGDKEDALCERVNARMSARYEAGNGQEREGELERQRRC
jgi:hypothetical protein